jgi:hypothetical protein
MKTRKPMLYLAGLEIWLTRYEYPSHILQIIFMAKSEGFFVF